MSWQLIPHGELLFSEFHIWFKKKKKKLIKISILKNEENVQIITEVDSKSIQPETTRCSHDGSFAVWHCFATHGAPRQLSHTCTHFSLTMGPQQESLPSQIELPCRNDSMLIKIPKELFIYIFSSCKHGHILFIFAVSFSHWIWLSHHLALPHVPTHSRTNSPAFILTGCTTSMHLRLYLER